MEHIAQRGIVLFTSLNFVPIISEALLGPFGSCLASKLAAHALHLQSHVEEVDDRDEEELWSLAVVVALEADDLLIAKVLLMQFLGVMGMDEVISFSVREEGRLEGVAYVIKRREVMDVEVRFGLNGASHQFERATDQQLRDLGVLLGQFVHEHLHVREW